MVFLVMLCALMAAHEAKAATTAFVNAKKITIGTDVTGSVTAGYNSAQNDYKFTLSQAGAFWITFSNPTQSTTADCWKVAIFNSSIEEIYSATIDGTSTVTEFFPLGLESGTYYIRVTSANMLSAVSKDTYTLKTSFNASDYWESESNDSFSKADEAVLESSYYGAVMDAQDKDYYYVKTTEDGVMTITFERSLQGDNSAYWELYLYDSSFTEIYSTTLKGGSKSTVIPRMGLVSGTYYVMIKSSNSYLAKTTDPYTLKCSFNASDNWEKERNDTPSTATSIEKDYWYKGTTSSGYNYDKDYYSFEVVSKGNYRLTFKTPLMSDSSVYWLVYVCDEDYNEIEKKNIKGSKEKHTLDVTLSEGSYYVYVTSSAANKASSESIYNFKIEKHALSVKSIKLSKSSMKIYLGNKRTLTYTLSPAKASSKVTWKSSDTSVATVSKKGVVKAKKAGTCTITVTTSNGKKDRCKVTVR